jgi:hypothetical protein
MGKRRIFGSSMPVLFTRRNKDDHTGCNYMLLIYGGYNSFAFSDIQELFTRMGMELIAGTGRKFNINDLDFPGSMIFFQNKLGMYLTSEE